MPEWLASLDEEDVSFIKKFVLASGSLKEVAGIYGVTYPTVRLRLDRLIQKIRLGEQADEEPYIALIKRLAVKDKLDFDTAKLLINEYKKAERGEQIMLIATVSTIISLIFLIAFVAAMIILQVYLSRRESKLPGLVLPAITFSGELFILLNVVTNVVMTSAADNAVGGVDSYSVFVTVLNTVLTLLVISMPTIVLLVIYFLCRRGMNRKKQIEKMNIQDL